MCYWKVWYSLLKQSVEEKISDKFNHIGKWFAKVYWKQREFILLVSVAPKMSFIAPTQKNLKCTALICINALYKLFWYGSRCPKVETIKNAISIFLDLICIWDHEFKINIKLIMNQNAMLICAIQFAIHIVQTNDIFWKFSFFKKSIHFFSLNIFYFICFYKYTNIHMT